MDSTQAINVLLVVFLLALNLVTIAVYAWVGVRIAKKGGKVPVEKFGWIDLIVGGTLVAYLVLTVILGFAVPQKKLHDPDVLTAAKVEFGVVAFLCLFLLARGISIRTQFGLRAVSLDKVAGFAIALLLASYPLLMSAALITPKILGPEAKGQEVVELFMKASRDMDYRAIIGLFIMGTVIAPITEELVFRGYIYGILKRYLGITAGVVLNAALFAGIHLTAAALPALFLFAICLTLAYEFTGSILVNICMHSLFNFISLTLTFYQSASPR